MACPKTVRSCANSLPCINSCARSRETIYELSFGKANWRCTSADSQHGRLLARSRAFQKLLDERRRTHGRSPRSRVYVCPPCYQEAYKHLKTALDLEEPKDRLTAGYLALCAACGKPDRPEDKGPNIAWAIRTIRQFSDEIDSDGEWTRNPQASLRRGTEAEHGLECRRLAFSL